MSNLTKIYVQSHLINVQSLIELDETLEYLTSEKYDATEKEEVAINETIEKIMSELLNRGFNNWDELKDHLKGEEN